MFVADIGQVRINKTLRTSALNIIAEDEASGVIFQTWRVH